MWDNLTQNLRTSIWFTLFSFQLTAHGSISHAPATVQDVKPSSESVPMGRAVSIPWGFFLLNFQLQIPFFPSADNEICASVAENPQNYLVPHPTDCTKFFSCQSLGHNRGWIAHLMDCPATTGFDTKLRICNYIKSLPRCNNEGTVHLQLQCKPHHRGLVTKLCVLYPNSMPGIPLHLSFKYSELPQ